MRAAHPDEYQDGRTAGSLVLARRCWLDLLGADTLVRPQRFTFVFRCPSEPLARGLTDFLRYAHYAGFVRAADAAAAGPGPAWRVAGTTLPAVWSLESLEHLFMDLRRAGVRYGSTLASLDLLPMTDGSMSGASMRARKEEQ